VVDVLAADAVPLPEVQAVYDAFAAVERRAAAGRVLLARRMAETAQWRRKGFASPADWLASKNGTSTGRARAELGTSERLKGLPETADALKDGRLSAEQADLVSDGASADPAAERELLDRAQRDSVKNLKEECGRRKAAADPDPEARHRRIHRERRCGTFGGSDGSWNLGAKGTVTDGAIVTQALERLIDERFTAARKLGLREPREAYAFDALVELARRALDPTSMGPAWDTHDDRSDDGDDHNRGGSSSRSQDVTSPKTPRSPRVNPKHLALIRVDLEALVRGQVEGDELCEITGLGPIPIRVARGLLSDSIIKLVITKGADVANVTHLGRGVNTAQQMALMWSDPLCRVEGCNRTARLENDHREGWVKTHTTRLDDTDPVCGHHHDLKTYKNWRLIPGEGRRPMVPPDHPHHPNNTGPPGPSAARPSGDGRRATAGHRRTVDERRASDRQRRPTRDETVHRGHGDHANGNRGTRRRGGQPTDVAAASHEPRTLFDAGGP
jgi:hypothetical protein